MQFDVVDKAKLAMKPDSGESYRWVFICQADENITPMSDEAIKQALFASLERAGIPVEGIYCQHDYDCCANFYPDAVDVLYIDRSYDQVICQQVFHQNV